MSRDPQLRLADIVDACSRIATYIGGSMPSPLGRI